MLVSVQLFNQYIIWSRKRVFSAAVLYVSVAFCKISNSSIIASIKGMSLNEIVSLINLSLSSFKTPFNSTDSSKTRTRLSMFWLIMCFDSSLSA